MMNYGELATYLGIVRIVLSDFAKEEDEISSGMLRAVEESQLYFMQKALDTFRDIAKEKSE